MPKKPNQNGEKEFYGVKVEKCYDNVTTNGNF